MVAIPSPLREPGTPEWWGRFLLRVYDLFVSTNPTKPVKIPAYATADLPDPAMFADCIAIDSTLGAVVYSNGSAWV